MTMDHPQPPLYVAILTYLSYGVLIVFGHLRDFSRAGLTALGLRWLLRATSKDTRRPVGNEPGYCELLSDFDNFYTRRLYHRIQDCWNRPVCSAPGAYITLPERLSDDYNLSFKLTGKTHRCLNLGSYNYLGFAENHGPTIAAVTDATLTYGISSCGSRATAGNTRDHVELENLVARFLGKPAAMIFGMGFATNSTVIPALCGKGSLVISDTLNHSSIVQGCRVSGAKIKTFRHNDPDDLEAVLRHAIAYGQPRTHRPWKKIIVIVEGIYSMEGEICRLAEIVAVKKKYKAYLYLDEAHSIGALGATGRGVCEHTGVSPDDVDILMGTFTKSFGGVGGYIASTPELIQYLKSVCIGHLYANAMAPPVARMVQTTMKIIMGEDGTNDGQRRIHQLRDNANYFRRRLVEMGFVIYGDNDSPVVPLMLYYPCAIAAFSREALKRSLAVVVVGYPATPIIESRSRFCLSAAHTREDIDKALDAISDVGDVMGLKFNA
ncbi:serine palmitoyltransferase 2, variant [Thecamonas trahens ATCC 50062]|uniref:serine C-palmitoyltransferase n=1 Tax=Thecamonas trahens ATCC 50062 TaxID=461836 RepID=A0A0L0D864_THETB|nr:serine palmitoyltransferase 2 [Thecamonas trahens ATCC 50062]XP_013758826.1 serine palmitoyltransferase 2, variant [Thecamonas trahens ATCC 50062]KNC48256.1 serine palmitoyltransferase 2, variant [Thecamonas trahens ATCC 50062]KNC48257.1 serine palmitoyltransferase 2 [Thecamonas trahens ATCC 50062]|eukprot:XP_013758825.1 serine palmitoyltransferase 2 [Thecamonas trahens ATCC 50062]